MDRIKSLYIVIHAIILVLAFQRTVWRERNGE